MIKDFKKMFDNIKGVLAEDFTLIVDFSDRNSTRIFSTEKIMSDINTRLRYLGKKHLVSYGKLFNLSFLEIEYLCGQQKFNFIVNQLKQRERELKHLFKLLPHDRQKKFNDRFNEGIDVGKNNVYDTRSKELLWSDRKHADYKIEVNGSYPTISERFPVVITNIINHSKTIIVEAVEKLVSVKVVSIDNNIPRAYSPELNIVYLNPKSTLEVGEEVNIFITKEKTKRVIVEIRD
ncbi:MAG: hypothetical protein LBL47_02745 [Lactobacillus sp.]|jgi:hypothetical protein|nr:hypothetical protein [Lactobacillus sp.]